MKRFLLILALLLLASDCYGCGLFSRMAARRAARQSARHAHHTVSHTTTTTTLQSSGCGCNCSACSCSPATQSSSGQYDTTTRIVYNVPQQSMTSVPGYPYAVPARFSGNCPGGVCPIP